MPTVSPLLHLVTGDASGVAGNGFSLALFQTDTTFYIDSDATNLIAGDTNGRRDIFFKNFTTGAISRVSTTSTGAQADGDSSFIQQSADGHAILFSSNATNLFAGGSGNGSPFSTSLYVKNLTTGTVTQVDTSSAGVHGNGFFSYGNFISNTQVLLMSDSSNLVSGDTNKAIDIFIKDLSTGAITLVSTNSSGVEGNKGSFALRMSADNHKIYFASDATNMVTGDTNAHRDFFVKDLTTGAVTRLSTTSTGAQINGDSTPFWIAEDDSKVIFLSSGTNLASGDTNGSDDIFIKNLTTGAVTVLTSNSAGQIANGASEALTLTMDGGKVVFSSLGTNLASGDTNNSADVFIKDVNTGALTRVFTTPDHRDGDAYEFSASFAENGTKLVLQVTYHNELDDNAALMNGGVQLTTTSVYVIDVATQAATLIASGSNGTVIGAGGSSYTLFANDVSLSGVSPDGHHLLLSNQQWTASDLSIYNPVSNDFLYTIGSGLVQKTVGGSGNDSLTGGSGTDYLFGMAGNDTLNGSSGADVMAGGVGNDTYYVNSSGDQVFEASGAGTDTVNASTSFKTGSQAIENVILTGSANINADGNTLANTLTGNSGNNTLKGIGGNDILSGGGGNDVLDGGSGSDTMSGGTGDDTYYVDNSHDIVTEASGEGTDTVYANINFSAGSQYIENIVLIGSGNITASGNSLANTITGNSGNNTLKGIAGDDTLVGGGGNDVLDGGSGSDTMSGGTGDDTYYVDNSHDVVTEASGEGTDTVYAYINFNAGSQYIENIILAGSGNINASGNSLANTITGNSGNNTLKGIAGDDTLSGGAGNDVLDGGSGSDTMSGGTGDDTYYVDNSHDVVTEASGEGTDTVYAYINFSAGSQDIENITLAGSGNINATGNTLANVLTGNAGNNVLGGGAGADTFVFNTGSGKDTISDFSLADNDTINLHAYTAGVAHTAYVTQVGADVHIDLGGGNVITVLGATNNATFLSHIVW